MKKIVFLIYALFISVIVVGQEQFATEVDSLYREDQFYVGITYNLIANKLDGMAQNRFSPGFQIGFIRDMPVNKRRNLAIGLGLGYALNFYNQNLVIDKDKLSNLNYAIVRSSTFTKNRFATHLVELPLEFRWRTSTPESYSFWRLYTGIKLGYVFSNASKYKGELGTLKHVNIDGFNAFKYGLTLSLGYNTWNFYAYYGLNPLFSEQSSIEGTILDMNSVNIGLMFYVL